MSKGDGATSFDYVIVGAGSAGCVIAARLSADPSVSVLLVEAGPSDDMPGMDVPILAPRLLNGPYDWSFRTARVFGVDGLRVADASVFPRITRSNTNAPAIMVGEKAADLLKLGKGVAIYDVRKPG